MATGTHRQLPLPPQGGEDRGEGGVLRNPKRLLRTFSLFTLVLLLVSPLTPLPAQSQDRIVPDRPDVAESSLTVPRGSLQIEGGISYARTEVGRLTEDRVAGPVLLLRYGLLENFELRVGGEGAIYLRTDERGSGLERAGGSDAFVGFKIHLLDERGYRPSIALLGSASIPTGRDAFTSDEVEPTTLLSVDQPLPGPFGLGINLGYTRAVGDDEERFDRVAAAVSLSLSATPRLNLFVETFGDLRADEAGRVIPGLDGGALFYVSDLLTLDFSVTVGLDEDGPDFGLGAGLAHRF